MTPVPTPSRLDRLSALLAGLAPAVSMHPWSPEAALTVSMDRAEETRQGLRLYLVTAGAVVLTLGGCHQTLQAPALVACRADASHALDVLADGQEVQLVAARAEFSGPAADLFLVEFEDAVIIQPGEGEPALQMAMALISAELQAPRCGQPTLLNRAGDILFIGLLRHLVAHPRPMGSGLFNGLADPRIARALVAMHQHPGDDWSLERLAEEAGMSRTAFAGTFRQVMRQTPGKYLAAIRLAIAQQAVTAGKGLKLAAKEAGYANASALSRALSRRAQTAISPAG